MAIEALKPHKPELELLTSSRLRAFRACARQHLYGHVQGYRSLEAASALVFGTAMHEALAAWWSAPRDRAFGDALAKLPLTMAPFDRARAEAMLAGYHAYWSQSGFEAVEIEREFRLPLINPETGHASRTWMLAGKVDAIVRGPDGRWVLEHKTTSEDCSPGSPYRRRLALDGQVSQYVEGAASLGYHVAGVLYDVLVKPQHRPLLATPSEARKYTKAGSLYASQRDRDETPAEYRERVASAIMEDPTRYYAAVEVVRLEDERDEYAYDVWQLAELMRMSARTGRAPRNPDACFRYSTPCEFFDVCTGVTSLDDPLRFKHVGAAPELSNEERQVACQ